MGQLRSTIPQGPAKLAAMDESFFTKLIYASGYRGTATPRPLPLILDTNVRKALVRDGGILKHEKWSLHFYPQSYRRYLLIAQTWADLWATRSDSVEYSQSVSAEPAVGRNVGQ
jgi:hypothetical protein